MKLLKTPRRPRVDLVDLLESRRLFAALTPGLSITGNIDDQHPGGLVHGRRDGRADAGGRARRDRDDAVQSAGAVARSEATPVRTDSNAVGSDLCRDRGETGHLHVARQRRRLERHRCVSCLPRSRRRRISVMAKRAPRRKAAGAARRGSGPAIWMSGRSPPTPANSSPARSPRTRPAIRCRLAEIMFAPDGSVVGQQDRPRRRVDRRARTIRRRPALILSSSTNRPDASAGRYGITFARLPGKQATEDPDTNHSAAQW